LDCIRLNRMVKEPAGSSWMNRPGSRILDASVTT
jgi:hypothetical protein